MCLNVECGAVNKVPYGKTHHMKKKGMPCFDINTRLGGLCCCWTVSGIPFPEVRRQVPKTGRTGNIGRRLISVRVLVMYLKSEQDIEKLPEATPKGRFKLVMIPSGEPSFISFEFETTDLNRSGPMPDILQIAASAFSTGATFNQYVLPTSHIAPDAERITGIRVSDSHMTVHGKQVDSKELDYSLDHFCNWLRKFPNPILVAHNGRRFDFSILINSFQSVSKLKDFFECCVRMIDSLSIFRKLCPKVSHKQEGLVSNLLGITYEAHNAIADVTSLKDLVLHTQLSSKELLGYSYPPSDVYNSLLFNQEKNKNMSSLHCLVSSSVCKIATAENIAGSALNIHHLNTIYRRSGEDCLRDIFTNKNSDGAPRVTNVKKVLDEEIPKMAAYFSKVICSGW